MMDFESYLTKKNIDGEAFKKQDLEQWSRLKELFDQVHPKSFEMQKKFLINDIRRKYQLS